ncbi:PAS domain-containing sensor histidine kinase [Granulicella sp. dw_53]|uniref:PAS domain-containing sensor histidine kinase n=1 Tax=Granulicella sp. dw_53 TaxID=2719792 RepID=UPI001BD6BF18|nr:PAS domain-containing sensor histidine kinase [Granulicella sp. dw_53]
MRQHESVGVHPESSLVQVDSDLSATYLSALIEHSPIAIIVLDADHRYTMCNPAFRRLFQYSSDELESSDLDTLIAAPRGVQEATNLTRRVLAGEKVHTVTQRRRKDGMTVDVELYGIPLMVNDRLAGVYGLYQDVTERNQARNAFRTVADKLEHIQQEERSRLARDLHDSTSQELAVLNWNLRKLMQLVADGDETIKALVYRTTTLAYECSERIRSASYLLHPPLLDHSGLAGALVGLAEGFEQRSGIRVDLTIPRKLGRFSDEVEVALFRVVQEGLANVLRHSGSTVVHISLKLQANWLKLTLADEGTGAEPREARRNTGTGINGMRQRLEQLGGLLTMHWTSSGTTITADLPTEYKIDA